jgi:putative IMPACT (imprinted ancient) family translation regulator
MLFEDTYRTIEKPSEGTYKDRGSKFIALAFPVSTEEEVKKKTGRTQKKIL